MARQIELPLKSITLYLGNVHIYENNIPGTRALIGGDVYKRQTSRKPAAT